jgi:hypothetical protein
VPRLRTVAILLGFALPLRAAAAHYSTVTELIKCNHLCMRYNSLEPADVFSVLFKAATQVLDMPLATMTMRWTQCALCLSAILLGFARQLH